MCSQGSWLRLTVEKLSPCPCMMWSGKNGTCNIDVLPVNKQSVSLTHNSPHYAHLTPAPLSPLFFFNRKKIIDLDQPRDDLMGEFLDRSGRRGRGLRFINQIQFIHDEKNYVCNNTN